MSDEPREGGSVPKRLRPTNLGRIAINHGVLTEPCWWAKQAEEANRLADEGVEWELMLSERIDGLSALLAALTAPSSGAGASSTATTSDRASGRTVGRRWPSSTTKRRRNERTTSHE
jgi:hypothetical protein